ncbi:GntR family transcriptional regulator [Streptomyces sp. NPDC016640]|uniref:GntR family transcriptional regulator n=1 Tax=Streptomyces sp. NPDC016640 TaxID=3364969 RepID=UPI0036F849A2
MCPGGAPGRGRAGPCPGRRTTPGLDRTRPVRRQVAAAVSARIADGTCPVGARVPPVVESSAQSGIAASTAQKVLSHLKGEGLIRAEVGLGSFVAERPEGDGGAQRPQ